MNIFKQRRNIINIYNILITGGPGGPGTGTKEPPEPDNPSFPGSPLSPFYEDNIILFLMFNNIQLQITNLNVNIM